MAGFLNNSLLETMGSAAGSIASPAVTGTAISGLAAAGIWKLLKDNKSSNMLSNQQTQIPTQKGSIATLLSTLSPKDRVISRVGGNTYQKALLAATLRISTQTPGHGKSDKPDSKDDGKGWFSKANDKYNPLVQFAKVLGGGDFLAAKDDSKKLKQEKDDIKSLYGVSDSAIQLYQQGYIRRIISGSRSGQNAQLNVLGALYNINVQQALEMATIRKAHGIETLPHINKRIDQKESWLGNVAQAGGRATDLPGIEAIKNALGLTKDVLGMPKKVYQITGGFLDTAVNKFKDFFSGGMFGTQGDDDLIRKSGREKHSFVDEGLAESLSGVSFSLERIYLVLLETLKFSQQVSGKTASIDSVKEIEKRGQYIYDSSTGQFVTLPEYTESRKRMRRDVYASSAFGKARLGISSFLNRNKKETQTEAMDRESQLALGTLGRTMGAGRQVEEKFGKPKISGVELDTPELKTEEVKKIIAYRKRLLDYIPDAPKDSSIEYLERIAKQKVTEEYLMPEEGLGGIESIRKISGGRGRLGKQGTMGARAAKSGGLAAGAGIAGLGILSLLTGGIGGVAAGGLALAGGGLGWLGDIVSRRKGRELVSEREPIETGAGNVKNIIAQAMDIAEHSIKGSTNIPPNFTPKAGPPSTSPYLDPVAADDYGSGPSLIYGGLRVVEYRLIDIAKALQEGDNKKSWLSKIHTILSERLPDTEEKKKSRVTYLHSAKTIIKKSGSSDDYEFEDAEVAARGGLIQGPVGLPKGVDNVPIMAQDGEMILPTNVTSFFENIFSKKNKNTTGSFAEGGVVDAIALNDEEKKVAAMKETAEITAAALGEPDKHGDPNRKGTVVSYLRNIWLKAKGSTGDKEEEEGFFSNLFGGMSKMFAWMAGGAGITAISGLIVPVFAALAAGSAGFLIGAYIRDWFGKEKEEGQKQFITTSNKNQKTIERATVLKAQMAGGPGSGIDFGEVNEINASLKMIDVGQKVALPNDSTRFAFHQAQLKYMSENIHDYDGFTREELNDLRKEHDGQYTAPGAEIWTSEGGVKKEKAFVKYLKDRKKQRLSFWDRITGGINSVVAEGTDIIFGVTSTDRIVERQFGPQTERDKKIFEAIKNEPERKKAAKELAEQDKAKNEVERMAEQLKRDERAKEYKGSSGIGFNANKENELIKSRPSKKQPPRISVEDKNTNYFDIEDAIQKASKETGVPFDYLMAAAAQESSMGTNASNLFQMGDLAWQDAEMGIGWKKGRDDPYLNSLAAAKYHLAYKDKIPKELREDPTAWYLLHFLGPTDGLPFLRNIVKNSKQVVSKIGINVDKILSGKGGETNKNILTKTSTLKNVYTNLNNKLSARTGEFGLQNIFTDPVKMVAGGLAFPTLDGGIRSDEASTSRSIRAKDGAIAIKEENIQNGILGRLSGLIPGIETSKDDVPIMAQAGELIIPRDLSRRLIKFFKKVISNNRFKRSTGFAKEGWFDDKHPQSVTDAYQKGDPRRRAEIARKYETDTQKTIRESREKRLAIRKKMLAKAAAGRKRRKENPVFIQNDVPYLGGPGDPNDPSDPFSSNYNQKAALAAQAKAAKKKDNSLTGQVGAGLKSLHSKVGENIVPQINKLGKQASEGSIASTLKTMATDITNIKSIGDVVNMGRKLINSKDSLKKGMSGYASIAEDFVTGPLAGTTDRLGKGTTGLLQGVVPSEFTSEKEKEIRKRLRKTDAMSKDPEVMKESERLRQELANAQAERKAQGIIGTGTGKGKKVVSQAEYQKLVEESRNRTRSPDIGNVGDITGKALRKNTEGKQAANPQNKTFEKQGQLPNYGKQLPTPQPQLNLPPKQDTKSSKNNYELPVDPIMKKLLNTFLNGTLSGFEIFAKDMFVGRDLLHSQLGV